MIDIHCHIAPGLDDGPRSLATSLTMAEMAAADGIEVIIATPHADGAVVTPERVAAAVRSLNRELRDRRVPLTVLPGFELPHHLALELAASHTLAGSRYVLIEFPHDFMPGNAALLISELLGRGLLPVIAHPERNGDIIAAPERLAELVAAGAQVQVTGGSVTGDLGLDCQRCAHLLLSRDLVHYLATDSHSPSFRAPELRRAHGVCRKILGAERAALLTEINPRRILINADPESYRDLAAPC